MLDTYAEYITKNEYYPYKGEKGLKLLAHKMAGRINKLLKYAYYKIVKKRDTFTFNGGNINYFYHWYNYTFDNERVVEIPIILSELTNNKNLKILEVGNVLNHYVKLKHNVIDKYEKYPNVINEDIADHATQNKYDLIVSISTLEHVGWDETPKDPAKILKAIEKVKMLLKDTGKAIITIPLGYNKYFDHLLFNENKIFDSEYYLKRISSDNRWEQVNKRDVISAKYNSPFVAANGLLIGIIYGATKE